jgi:site-specific recombinase XerD
MGEAPEGLPAAAVLSALRAWYEGLGAREAVVRYLPDKKRTNESSRAMLGRARRQLAAFARQRHRPDLAQPFEGPASARVTMARAAARSIEQMRDLPPPQPLIGDELERWLDPRVAKALQACGMRTLADLTVRIPRRARWWVGIPGLGAIAASRIEAFFAKHPALTESARALIACEATQDVVPWERLKVPRELDGSNGALRAPSGSCALRANNDYAAVRAWIGLHESPATQRAYRKEAERLMLWAIVERELPLSSLTTEDATAYRKFLRHPTPQVRWVGPSRPRTSLEWRPFNGKLSSNSVAYTVSVLGALFRWLVEQRYLLANPFAGMKVRGAGRKVALDRSKALNDSEWSWVMAVANLLEVRESWTLGAAQRLRFVLTFAKCTGLRPAELVHARLGDVSTDAQGHLWLMVTGKGVKPGKVARPAAALAALEMYLAQRGLSTVRRHWLPATPLIGALEGEADAGITSGQLWRTLRRFFDLAATSIEADVPAAAERLRRATPHWLRHTHATFALSQGVELTSVRDNLRHASIATTSTYLHGDDAKRSKQMDKAFAH